MALLYAAPATAQDARPWALTVAADAYVVPGSPFFVSSTVTADRGWLHIEGRYNYEDKKTASIWFGYNASIGKRLVFEVTPMFAGVFGNINGIAPGYQATLSYGRLALSDTAEYVADLADSSRSYYYTWPQFTVSLADWLAVGVAAQRTKAYQADYEVQSGVVATLSFSRVEFSSYAFAGRSSPTLILEAVLK